QVIDKYMTAKFTDSADLCVPGILEEHLLCSQAKAGFREESPLFHPANRRIPQIGPLWIVVGKNSLVADHKHAAGAVLTTHAEERSHAFKQLGAVDSGAVD